MLWILALFSNVCPGWWPGIRPTSRGSEADEGEVDLTVVAAIAEQSQLPQLLAPELQDWGDVLETNTSHRQ